MYAYEIDNIIEKELERLEREPVSDELKVKIKEFIEFHPKTTVMSHQ